MKTRRVLLKISGQLIAGPDGLGADGSALLTLCDEIAALRKKKIQVAVVIGGGNFWRYRDKKKLSIPRSASDAIGMLATLMNARLLEEALNQRKIPAAALAAHGEFYFTEPYVPNRGKKLLEHGTVVICAGGTGNPYFTTDTAAALRALELECDLLLKMTQVDGVYNQDPVKNSKAKRFLKLSYAEYLKRELQVMDLTAITLCKENKLPIRVFKGGKGAALKAACSTSFGTLIS